MIKQIRHQSIETVVIAIVEAALRHRILACLVLACIVLPLGFITITHFGNQDNSFDIWFEHDNPHYTAYKQFKEEFESDEIIAIAFECEDIFAERPIKLQRMIVQALQKIPDILKVRSLFTTNTISGRHGDLLIEPPLPLSGEIDRKMVVQARKLSENDENMVANLFSKDLKVVIVLGQIANLDKQQSKGEIITKIAGAIANLKKEFPEYLVQVTGTPIMDYEFDRLARLDQQTFFPIVLLMTVIIFILIFRRPTLFLTPTFIQVGVIFATIGLYYLFIPTSNMVMGMIVPIILSACIGDSVHILDRYVVLGLGIENHHQRLIETIRDEARPCFFTSITTAAGFFSFISSEVGPIRHLGVFTAIGCLAACLITIVYIPVILSFFPHRPKKTEKSKENNTFLNKSILNLAMFNIRRPRTILAIAVVIGIVFSFGINKVKVEVSGMEFIDKSNPVRAALDFIQARVTGLSTVELIIEGKPDLAKDPQLLRQIDRMWEEMQTHPTITGMSSYISYLKRINQVMNGDNGSFYRIPDTKEQIAQLLLLAEASGDADIGRFVNFDYSKVRISLRLLFGPSHLYNRSMDTIKTLVAKHLPGRKILITGLVPLYRNLDELLISSQFWSILAAFVMIFLFIWMLTRRLLVAIIAMFPNILPIVMTIGVMGFVGVAIDPATVLMAGIALGIVVDDTIHFINRISIEVGKGADYPTAVITTSKLVGPAIVLTSIILSASFLILVLGHFPPTRNFGLLTALTMGFALLGDIILLPALLIVFKPMQQVRFIKPAQE